MKTFTYISLLILLCGCATIDTASDKAINKKNQSIEVVELAKTTKSWNGQTLPNYPQGQPEITILRITIPAGTTLPLHKHLVINAAVLLKGKLKVVSDSNHTLYLNPGDSIVELVNRWHYGINEGDEPVEILVFYAGAVGIPITVKKPEE